MIYRTLGRTGLRVSQLGLGAMRLPMVGAGGEARVDRELAIPLIERAVAGGINYLDSAVGYCNQDSQRAIGEAIRSCRDKVILSTKNPYYGTDEKLWWTNLENSLERLGTQWIDIYSHHGARWEPFAEVVLPTISRWMHKARDQGLIRHIGCSFHDSAQAMRKIIDSDYVEVMTVQYNLLDTSLEEAIAYAFEKGVGVVVMGPVGGGRLAGQSQVLGALLPDAQSLAELAMRFVLANPHVSSALSGMQTIKQVEDNLGVAGDPRHLLPREREMIHQQLGQLKELAKLYCTGCGYCQPCERKVDIAAVFAAYNMGRVYGLWDQAKKQYDGLIAKGQAADQCAACGECEGRCPQRIAIREQLEQADRVLRALDSQRQAAR